MAQTMEKILKQKFVKKYSKNHFTAKWFAENAITRMNQSLWNSQRDFLTPEDKMILKHMFPKIEKLLKREDFAQELIKSTAGNIKDIKFGPIKFDSGAKAALEKALANASVKDGKIDMLGNEVKAKVVWKATTEDGEPLEDELDLTIGRDKGLYIDGKLWRRTDGSDITLQDWWGFVALFPGNLFGQVLNTGFITAFEYTNDIAKKYGLSIHPSLSSIGPSDAKLNKQKRTLYSDSVCEQIFRAVLNRKPEKIYDIMRSALGNEFSVTIEKVFSRSDKETLIENVEVYPFAKKPYNLVYTESDFEERIKVSLNEDVFIPRSASFLTEEILRRAGEL